MRKHNDLRTDYDFASMHGDIRGKHFNRYQTTANIVPTNQEADPSAARPRDPKSRSQEPGGRSAQDDKM